MIFEDLQDETNITNVLLILVFDYTGCLIINY